MPHCHAQRAPIHRCQSNDSSYLFSPVSSACHLSHPYIWSVVWQTVEILLEFVCLSGQYFAPEPLAMMGPLKRYQAFGHAVPILGQPVQMRAFATGGKLPTWSLMGRPVHDRAVGLWHTAVVAHSNAKGLNINLVQPSLTEMNSLTCSTALWCCCTVRCFCRGPGLSSARKVPHAHAN
ncbi:unnamed protein product [Ostreobium quekettii]|uniref:Uncharacterized protein n=1 Tax=Ostreobium quekettii TaxID=121088 RepID=A0A8S1IUH4_9CHLO|nr:unnamed protein product [Ostreobium quekettii]